MPYRPTERSEARRLRAREAIVAAALAQVAQGGYASASVQTVAARAGVATGSVYRHFASKADLFAEVFRRASQRELDVVARVADSSDNTARTRIAVAAEAFARRALAGPTLAYALIAEPVDPAVEAERLAFRRGYRDVFAGVLREAVASGELEPLDASTVAAALVGALGETLVGPLSPRAGAEPATGDAHPSHETLIASIVQFCLNAIGREPAHVRDHAYA
ncbi:MAG: TetR/AcrR family transcriptional regulator [Thermoleophilaceae bacterium]|jgi:AcrR family transcriptional regulator